MYSKCVHVRACVCLNSHCLKKVLGIVCELQSPLLCLSLTGSDRPHQEGRDADIGEMLRRYRARVFHCTDCNAVLK
jgi:hypothetical protein